MITAVSKTLNPAEGGGLMESITVYILLLAVVAMNFFGIKVNEEVHWALYLVLGYMFGTNNTPNWDGSERRGEDDNDVSDS